MMASPSSSVLSVRRAALVVVRATGRATAPFAARPDRPPSPPHFTAVAAARWVLALYELYRVSRVGISADDIAAAAAALS